MDLNNLDQAQPRMTGHVKISDPTTGQVILDKKNAIHFENMSLALGYSIAGNSTGFVYSMSFGNGGSAVSGTGAITYFPTNTIDPKADLYDPTYTKIITGTSTNYLEVRHLQGTNYTDVVVTCTLDYNEPAGQEAFDDSTSTEGAFVFDELGLKTKDGLLLTHVIFNPIQKSLNRLIEVVYTLRIQMN
jgi:uncharacterized protein (UPF0333 family)